MYILAAANPAAYEIGYKIGTVIGGILAACMFLVVPILFIIFLVMAIRKKTGGWITVTIITGVLSLISVGLILFGITRAALQHRQYLSADQNIPANREIVSSDKTCKVTIPEHWKIIEKLSETAVITAGNLYREEYLMVLVDPKDNYDETMTLKRYADSISDNVINSLQDGSKDNAKELEINGLKAIEYKIYGTSNHVKLVYLHTTVEGKNTYYRIVGWTIPSKANNALATIRQAVSTFVELKTEKSDFEKPSAPSNKPTRNSPYKSKQAMPIKARQNAVSSS